MGKAKQTEIKNWVYYFYNHIIKIEEFNSNLVKIDKKSYKDIDIYYIGYITIEIGNCEKNGSKYLVFDSAEFHSTDENQY